MHLSLISLNMSENILINFNYIWHSMVNTAKQDHNGKFIKKLWNLINLDFGQSYRKFELIQLHPLESKVLLDNHMRNRGSGFSSVTTDKPFGCHPALYFIQINTVHFLPPTTISSTLLSKVQRFFTKQIRLVSNNPTNPDILPRSLIIVKLIKSP